MKMKLLMTSVLSTSLFLVACGGGSSDDGPATTNPSGTPTNNIQNPVVKVEAYTSTNLGSVAAESSILTYKMLGQSGQEVQATSLVFTPNTPQPVGGWPIVVWAHGTTGVADACAPSKAALADSTKDLISKLLAAGYVVVAPDYEGLGTPGIHPFLNVKSEAFSITDAVVAARNYLSQRNLLTSKKWVTVGHSQGGHAALGAAQYASRAQLEYKGTVAVAPASNLGFILIAGEQSVANATLDKKISMYAQLDTYTALVTAGIRNTQPTFDYPQVFTPQISISVIAFFFPKQYLFFFRLWVSNKSFLFLRSLVLYRLPRSSRLLLLSLLSANLLLSSRKMNVCVPHLCLPSFSDSFTRTQDKTNKRANFLAIFSYKLFSKIYHFS